MGRLRAVILGSGNVASHLAHGLQNSGSCEIVQIYSRKIDHAVRLAEDLSCTMSTIDDLSMLITDADFYLISVADAAVSEIASSMPKVDGLVAHTSGSIPLSGLHMASPKIAVLYPLQTFTREAYVDLQEIPFFTEGGNKQSLEEVDSIASLLSPKVYHADSKRRKTLHIAGVLSCNFVNYLWDCTSQVLGEDGYDFSVVEPLIRATLDKAVKLGPRASQTGPAMRCDKAVIEEHMHLLRPEMSKIYRDLTNAIFETHKLDCKI